MKVMKFYRENYKFFIAVSVAVFGWFVFSYFTISINTNTRDELVELDASRSLNQYSLVLGDIFSKIDVIETFVITRGIDNITEDGFNEFAENQSFEEIGFVSFSIAPDGIIEYYYSDIYNQDLIGLDLVNDEREHVRDAVEYAIENKVVVVNGPFDLLLGDQGIVFRKPIFTDDEFVGIINLVIDVETLYEDLNRYETNRIHTAVYNVDDELILGITENSPHESHYVFSLIDFDYVDWHIGVDVSQEFIESSTRSNFLLGFGFTVILIVVLFLWIFYYVRNRLLIEKQKQLIYYDNLTELPNRMLFKDETQALINNNEKFFLGFGDLDNFKNINDVLGHSVGDQYLGFVTSKLKRLLSENLRIYRWGGDEFIFIFVNISKDELHEVMGSIFEIFRQPFEVKETKHQISISIGVVAFPLDGVSLDDLVKRADIVMYDIKSQQKNAYSFFEQRYLDDLYTQIEFQQTIEKYNVEDFELFLQPIVDVKTGITRGFEGLSRLFNPEGKVFPIHEIIKLYEQDGTITKLDKYVFNQICKYILDCEKAEYGHYFFTFNISPLSLTKDYIDFLEETVNKHQIDPNQIVMEIIETLGFKDVKISIELLKRIKDIGFKIAMDDFGMGYSSLSYITKLPLDLIKIDRTFIQNYENNTFNRTIMHTITDISNSLNLDILVEGIETPSQLEFITNLGAQYYQGYLYSRPMSYKDLKKFLNKQSKEGLL